MEKILKSYRFDTRTLEKLEFIINARKELGCYNYNRTNLIELLIWTEAERMEKLLKKERRL